MLLLCRTTLYHVALAPFVAPCCTQLRHDVLCCTTPRRRRFESTRPLTARSRGEWTKDGPSGIGGSLCTCLMTHASLLALFVAPCRFSNGAAVQSNHHARGRRWQLRRENRHSESRKAMYAQCCMRSLRCKAVEPDAASRNVEEGRVLTVEPIRRQV